MTDWQGSEAADELRRAMRSAIPVEDPERVSSRKQQLLGVIEREIAQVPVRATRQEQRRQVARGLLAAAALLVTVGGAYTFLSGENHPSAASSGSTPEPRHVTTDTPGADETLEGRVRVEKYAGLAAPGSTHPAARTHASADTFVEEGHTVRLLPAERVRLTFPGRTLVEASHQAYLRVLEARTDEQGMRLDGGRVLVDVPEGRTRQRHVWVVTPHAQIEVKGTRFVVNVERDAEGVARRSTVYVERGKVLVRSQGESFYLLPGESWESEDAKKQVNLQAAHAPHANSRAQDASARVPRATPSGKPRSTSKSADGQGQLARQNSMLESAVVLAQRGETKRAHALLGTLLQQYPSSPLRSTVLAERRRLSALLKD